MYCNNQAAIFLANNPTSHQCTKHIEIYFCVIHHRVLDEFITTPRVSSSHEVADILTKGISMAFYDSISRKLRLFDLYGLAWGEVWYIG